MKKNLKLPILLLAVVVMMSIFYIKEANDATVKANTEEDSLNVSTLNPDFTEARLQGILEANALIDEYELKIASGELSADEVLSVNSLIDSLIERKNNEVALEEEILALYSNYEDVLVLIDDSTVNVSIYDDEQIDASAFIAVSKLSYQKIPTDYRIVINLVNSLE